MMPVRIGWELRVALSSACVALLSACSDEGGSTTTDVAPSGVAGASAAPGGSGGASGSPAASGSGGAGTSAAGMGNSAGGSGFTESGVCGRRGESPVSADSFEGYEELYLIGEDGFGEDICVVRFDVSRVGAAPGGCEGCAWSHLVEYRNPQVRTDVNGVCASSELGLDAAKIAEIDGSRVAYGFVNEYSGHVSVLMKYDAATDSWGPSGNANWSEQTGRLRFDSRDGICGY